MNGIGKRVVYVLRSDTDPSRHYIGVTENVDKRLEWHNAWAVWADGSTSPVVGYTRSGRFRDRAPGASHSAVTGCWSPAWASPSAACRWRLR